MSEQHPLLEAYLNGELDDQGYIDFNDWLRQDPEHLRQFAAAAFIAQELGEFLGEQTSDIEQATVTDKSSATQRGVMDAELLSLLQQMEASADAETVTPSHDELPPIHIDASTLNKEKYVAALTYVLQHTFTPKRLVTGGIAAALLLGAVLAIVFLSGLNPQEQLADLPEPPASIDDGLASKSIVATLTAEYDAVWDRRPGQDLYTGQRFTLNQGTAELATARGAIVSIEAPTTIELLNDNSLHLDTGRLFATVPSQATGFAVETPDARIIDIGTRFGVERLVNSNKTHVQVAEGEVRAAAIDSTGQLSPFVPLLAGQAAQITRGTGLAMADYEPARFSNDPSLSHLKPVAAKGQFIWSTNAPTDLRNNTLEAETPRVFLIKRGMLLDKPVAVDLDGPGTWDGKISPLNLEAGQRVDVYLAHFDPPGIGDADEKIEYTWSLAFDRPVSGLIADTRNIAKLNRYFEEHELAIQFTNEPGQLGPGLECQAGRGDRMRLNEDGRSIDLDFLVTEGTDQLFILVKSEVADE
jgi:hypothetical protein